MTEPHEQNPENPGNKKGAGTLLKWVAGIFLGLLVLLFIASFFLDEPLRKMTENKLNNRIKDYSIRVPKLHLQLIGLTVTLKEVTISQKAHPEPPVIYVPVLKASIHWREILSGKVVAEIDLNQPRLNINLPQLRAEAANKTPIKERGWQEAIQEVYPLKINKVNINDATVTYIDQDPKRPLNLSNLNFHASNIRNIHLPDKVYPSEFHLDTTIFGTGHGTVDGRANFLAQPHIGLKAGYKLEKVPIDYFKPVLARANVSIEGGVLKSTGNAEYAPNIAKAHVQDLEIQGLKVNYVHSADTAAAERKRAKKTGKVARKVSNKPDMLIQSISCGWPTAPSA